MVEVIVLLVVSIVKEEKNDSHQRGKGVIFVFTYYRVCKKFMGATEPVRLVEKFGVEEISTCSFP